MTFGLMGCFLFNSCSNDDDITDDNTPDPQGDYSDGVIVLNEGSFGDDNSSISYISHDYSTIEPDIFFSVNDESLGDTGQSITFDDEFAYIVMNVSNIIQIVDRYTFELVGSIESGLQSPRYAVIENGKMYVTNQNSSTDPDDDFIAIINLETLEVEKTIESTPLEYIQEEDGLIYVQNAAFGNGNEISVIDSNSDEIINTIETNEELNSFEIEDGILYALSVSSLEKIDLTSGDVIEEIEIETGDASDASNLRLEDDMIYYTVGSSVYVMNENAEEAPEEALFSYSSDSRWGAMYAFEVEDDRIFIGDAGEFSANGFVQVYNLSGELLEEFETGIGPNSVYVQD